MIKVAHRVQFSNLSGLCYSALLGICWEVKLIASSKVLGLGLDVEEGARTSMCLVGWGSDLKFHSPGRGYSEAMPKQFLILREFEITGEIQK